MKQTSFASAEYAGKNRQTRRERFLAEMNVVVPWGRLQALIESHCPRSGKVGRPQLACRACCACTSCSSGTRPADEALEDAL
jgi:IS5 family transposase